MAAAGFGSSAATYEQGRPSYPPGVVDLFAANLGVGPGTRVVDLAAGTGIDAMGGYHTYGQAENPNSPWSKDQTRLFAQGKWVHFPWTRAQIRRQRVDRYVVSGG